MLNSPFTLQAWLALVALTFSFPAYGDPVHYYAEGRQFVDNKGGDSYLNIWKPNPSPGVFSLSQQWYAGGSQANRQTVEGGWQVLPQKYNTDNPVLFIYWTADNYTRTGCYNRDCPAFVQVDNRWVLGVGGSITPYSVDGGAQYNIEMQWKLYDGNGWLYVKGSGDYVAVGYYPGSIFNGGQMSKTAQYVTYGGETQSSNDSDVAGQMGSGQFANTGYAHAAYQRTIFYIDTSLVSQWTTLEAIEPTPSCYTIDIYNNTGGAEGNYFFFGGPTCPLLIAG